jgi:hypothetical protein
MPLQGVSGGSEASDAVKTIESITSGIQTLITVTGTAVGGLVSLYKGLDFITSFGGSYWRVGNHCAIWRIS